MQCTSNAFPFSAIVSQDEMKRALLLAATDRSLGGVMVFGDRGTGKSTAVRALASLLPPMLRCVEEKPKGLDEDSSGAGRRPAAGSD
jgi:magnesium chelatase subunit I